MKYTTVPGWTLVEVLTSMAIVFLLTGTIGHIGGQQIQRARLLAAHQQADAIEIALETYALDCGTYPTEAQGLAALSQAPVLHPVPADWNGPYLEAAVGNTPWGAPYRYEAPGPDGQPYRVTFDEPSKQRSGGVR